MTILGDIATMVIQGDKGAVTAAVNRALVENIDPTEIIKAGLMQGLNIVGAKFEKMEMYLPEMLLSTEAVKAGIEIVKPHIKGEPIQQEGVIVFGTIQGDVHDLGKKIVAFYLDVSGFKVYDLGKDVPIYTFVQQAEEKGADIIAISALLSTTMAYIPDVIDELKRRGLRDKYIVMVGGGAVTPEWVNKIGADGTGADFVEATKVAKELMKARRANK